MENGPESNPILEAGDRLGDPRFFTRAGPFSFAQLAEILKIQADGDADRQFSGVAPLQTATPNDVSFLHNPRYTAQLRETRAGAAIIGEAVRDQVPPDTLALVCADPHLAWAKIGALFHPAAPLKSGFHPGAMIDPSAQIATSAEIGPLAVIGAHAVIGEGCKIEAHAVIGDGVVLGKNCRIGIHASVTHAILGERVYIYPGARIGCEGFGFAITAQGFVSVPQLGRVIIGNDVEVGANSTIDRGAAHDTKIGAGTRIDNLVQLGHNVQLGRNCVLAAQAGVSGSVIIEDFVQLGGQAGITGHLHVGKSARIGAQAGVMNDVEAGADVLGSPAMPKRMALLGFAALKRLAMQKRVKQAAPDE